MEKSLVVLRSVKNAPVAEQVEDAMFRCQWEDVVGVNAKVIVKPNLCTDEPDKVEASNTSPALLEAVCSILKRRTGNITIAESDGARYCADDAAKNTGVFDIVRKLGIRWSNFSRGELVGIAHPIFRKYGTLMPKELLEADAVINMPVIKTHALTLFTGSIKNLWGCVPRFDRILMHKHLDQLLADLPGICKPALNIMDGIICVEGRGPSNGIPRKMDIILAGNDPVALDATAMRLIGLNPHESRHVVLAAQRGYGELRDSHILKDGPFAEHRAAFIPAPLDFAVASMNYMTRYRFFVKYILFNATLFKYVRRLVIVLRKLGVLKDTPVVTS